MGLEDRARKHIAARDAKAAQEAQLGQVIARWEARQRARVQEILSEFIEFVRDHGVAQVSLFYVMPIVRRSVFGKERVELSLESVAQVWNIGDEPIEYPILLQGKVLTVTEDLRVIPVMRIQKASGEYVLAIDNRWARTFPPYSVPQRLDEIQPKDFQRSELDAFTMNPVALAKDDHFGIMMTQMRAAMELGVSEIRDLPDEPPWIEGIVERAAAAIIDRNTRI
jgi:hypothetical protein